MAWNEHNRTNKIRPTSDREV